MFELVVFLACRRATPEGPHGPGALARLPYTLEGVTYTWQIDDPAAEPPIRVEELWFYTRFVRTASAGFTRRFVMRVLEVNDDGSRTPILYPATARRPVPFGLGPYSFPQRHPVVSRTTVLRDLVFPRRGQYEFRLLMRRRNTRWHKSRWAHVASHYIALE